MAKIKPSALIDRFSGKLNGSIFMNTSNGVVLKSNNFTQQPNSVVQSIVRNQIGQVSQIWRSLSSLQRSDWQAQTVNYPYTNNLGIVCYYTGYQLFLKLNLNRQVNGQVALLSAPIFETLVLSEFFSLSADSSNLVVQFINKPANNFLQFWGVYPKFSSLPPKLSEFRYLTSAIQGVTSGNYNIFGDFQTVFGDIPVNSYVTIAFKDVNGSTGLASGLHSFQTAYTIS